MTARPISIGALCEPLSKQLGDVLSAEEGARLDQYSTAITKLHIRGLLSDAECDRARKRLMKIVQNTLNQKP